MLITINGKTEVINGMQDVRYLLDDTFGNEAGYMIDEMYKEEFNKQIDELEYDLGVKNDLLKKRHKIIIELLKKIKHLENEAKLDNDDYFHLEKDRNCVNQQYEALREGSEKLLDYLYGVKKIDKKKIISMLEKSLNDGENVPLF